MADDRSRKGAAERSKPSADQRYEIDEEAAKLGVPPSVVQQAIKSVGSERTKVEAEVRRLMREGA
jgi:hypothetical protein